MPGISHHRNIVIRAEKPKFCLFGCDETSTTAGTSTGTDTSAVPFLQNKALAGSVFGIGGAIVLVVLVSMVTMALRKSRKNRLENEALSEQLPWPAADDEEKLRGETPAGVTRTPSMGGTSADGHATDTTGHSMQMYGAPAAYGGYGGYGGPQAGYAPSAYPEYAPSTPAPQDGHYAQPQQWGAGQYNQAPYGGQMHPQSMYEPQQNRASQYSAEGQMANPYENVERHTSTPHNDGRGPQPY